MSDHKPLSDAEPNSKPASSRTAKTNAAVSQERHGDPYNAVEMSFFERLSDNLSYGIMKPRSMEAHRRSQEAMIKSEEKYRLLVDHLRNEYFFYSLDPKGRLTHVSPSVKTILGYTPEECLTHDQKLFTDNPLNKQAKSDIRRSCQGQAQPSFEIEMVHKDGSRRIFAVKLVPVRNDRGEVVSVDGLAHDVTHNKALEKQLRQAQKMEAIGTLAGGIAHDFNNILMAIFGYTEIAMDSLPPESPVGAYLAQVVKAGNRAKELVQQILTFSRQVEHERKPVRIQYIVKETLKLLRSSLPATIEIQSSIDTTSGMILADATQIHQVVLNLCTNAYHAMRSNGGVLRIALTTETIDPDGGHPAAMELPSGSYACLEVSDTGDGMEPDTLEKIFMPYFTTKPKGEGTGLGLAVVHGIVKDHDGHITADSQPGQGSIFRIYLPHLPQEPDTTAKPPTKPLPGGNERILLVDDVDTIVIMEKIFLEHLGYRVTAVTSSDEALTVFQSDPRLFDLVITDMTMPTMTGVQLAQRIFALRADMPIILCTGFSELISEEEAKAMGIRVFIMKPVVLSDLAHAVRQALTPEEV